MAVIDPRLMDKAERALQAAKRALAEDDTETAAERTYYSAYYAAWALLDGKGLPRPKTHHGLISEFSRHFVRNGPFSPEQGAVLSRLENLRLVANYTLEIIPVPRYRKGGKGSGGVSCYGQKHLTITSLGIG